MKQMHRGFKIASFTHFIVYSQNNFSCSCYFLLQTITISPAWEVKKSPSYIRKLHPFPLVAFASYLALRSWPSANRNGFSQEWQGQEKCVLGNSLLCAQRSPHLLRAHQVFASAARWRLHTPAPVRAEGSPQHWGFKIWRFEKSVRYQKRILVSLYSPFGTVQSGIPFE